MRLKSKGTQVGVKYCSECEYNLRCQECVYNKQSIEDWRKQAVDEFSEKLFKLCYEHKDNYKIDIVALQHLMEMAMGDIGIENKST